MSITVFPKLGEPRIAAGTFVIFSFDPPAYASVIDPDDELLSAAARQIKRKKYLGLVEGAGPLDVPKLRQNLDIRVVGLAPPQEGEDDEYPTGPHRCIPISPCTNHPDGREPLIPSAPLPWPAAYVHTLQLTNAFVSRIYHSNTENTTVSKEEMQRAGICSVRDRCAAAAERRALKPAVPEETYSNDEEEDYFYGSDEEYESGSDSSFDDPQLTIPSKAYMEIWEDLTAATSLGEPKDIGADFDEIMELGINWQQRKKQELRADAANMSNWATGVAESTFDCSEGDLDEAVRPEVQYGQEDCDELTPEDAIDERVQPRTRASVDHIEANGEQTHLESHPAAESVDTEDVSVPHDSTVQATAPRYTTADNQKGEGIERNWVELLMDWLRGVLRL